MLLRSVVLTGIVLSVGFACSNKGDTAALTQAEQLQKRKAEQRESQMDAEDTVKLPPRLRSTFDGGPQTKRKWVKRMLAEQRFQKELCGKTDYLLNCVTEFKNPEKGVVGPFTREDCISAVTDIVGRELNIGGQGQGLTGAFYSDSLPDTLKPGWQMDDRADAMGSRITQILVQKMIKFGGQKKKTPYCKALYMTGQMSAVNGN